MIFKHIVLFKIHDHVSDEDYQSAIIALQELGKGESGIIQWQINSSIDTRKGRVIIEEAQFKDEEAFQSFRTSNKHVDVGNRMKEIADWLVGDYIQ